MKPIDFAALDTISPDNINFDQLSEHDMMMLNPSWRDRMLLRPEGMSVARVLMTQGYHFLPPIMDCAKLLSVSLPDCRHPVVIRGDIAGQLIVTEGVKSHGWKIEGIFDNPSIKVQDPANYKHHIYECHAPSGEKWGEQYPCYMIVTETVFTPPVMIWFHENNWKLSEPVQSSIYLPTYYRSYRLGGMMDDPTFIIPAHKNRKQTSTHRKLGWPELWTMLPPKLEHEEK